MMVSRCTARFANASGGIRLDRTDCGHHADLEGWVSECFGCGSTAVQFGGGDELDLTSMGRAARDEQIDSARRALEELMRT